MNGSAPAAEYGGFSEVARHLTYAGPRVVSRQGIYAWWKNRKRNGFPAAHHLDEDGHKQFSIAEILSWYAVYKPPKNAHWRT